MKKIAIIFNGNIFDKKGLFNAVVNRSRFLIKEAVDYQVDIYNFQVLDSFLARFFRKTKKVKKVFSYEVEGLNIHVFWYYLFVIDHFLDIKLHFKPIFARLFFSFKKKNFNGYDLISAHSHESALLAKKVYKKYNIPYVVTWHGSDINVSPFVSKFRFNEVKEILETAACNFFVSEALCNTAKKITENFSSEILYNGVGDEFRRFNDYERKILRERNDVLNKKVVCFAGSVVDIKNVLILPEIFKQVQLRLKGNVVFWIIGDGKLLSDVEKKLNEYKLNFKCWGNISPENMIEYFNCIDVLVLPSKNEGLPLVVLEALSCGVNVVGSDVGGISEVIGKENVFSLNNNFVENISNRIIEMLKNNVIQELAPKFRWDVTARKELLIYKNILTKD